MVGTVQDGKGEGDGANGGTGTARSAGRKEVKRRGSGSGAPVGWAHFVTVTEKGKEMKENVEMFRAALIEAIRREDKNEDEYEHVLRAAEPLTLAEIQGHRNGLAEALALLEVWIPNGRT